MIDFRYHLVSIVAIFLSLTVGLVLGSTALSGPLLDTLKKESAAAAKRADELHGRQGELEDQIKGDQEFARSVAARVLADRLKGQSVVLVETPGAGQASLDAIAGLLGEQGAGATVTGRVAIQKKYLDDDQVTMVDRLAEQLRPAGMTFAEGAGPYDKAAQVLAGALVTRDSGKVLRDDASSKAIVEAFESAGLVTVSGKPAQHATLALMVAPSSPYQDGVDTDNKALISLASALDSAGRGTVLAGPTTAAGEGGLISALRGSGAAENVSTADRIDYTSGQIVAVEALADQLAGRTGQYGIGDGARGYAPSLAPEAGQ